MFEKLKLALSSYTFLGPKDIFQLISISKLRTIKKGEHIIKAGEYNYLGIFVLKGLLKSYITLENGEDRTMLFIPEKKNAGSYQTVLRNKPSVESVIALENSLLVITDFRKFEKLALRNPSLMLYQNKLMKDILAFTVDRLWFHMGLTPKERYLQFCKEFPKLEQRVKLKDLASYLGITATSLSRIRARIAQI